MKDELANLNETKFNAAVSVIQNLPKDGPYQPSHEMMLKFYGLYKQATLGPCNEPKPSFFDIVKGYKWKAWSSLGNMPKEEAMNSYVEELKKIIETMSYSEDVASFLEYLGPFYESADKNDAKNRDRNYNEFEISPKLRHQDSDEDERIHQNSARNGQQQLAFNGNINGDLVASDGFEKVYVKSSVRNDDCDVVNCNKSDLERSTNGLSALSSSKKISSDTESDEEYSEPAETPTEGAAYFVANEDVNAQPSVKTKILDGQPNHHYNSVTSTEVTCGGGDAAEANRIRRLAHNSNTNRVPGGERQLDGFGSIRRASMSLNGGAGGGRRPNNDGNQNFDSNSALDFDSRLFYVLRKIQQDLESVVHRMDALEVQAVMRHRQMCPYCQVRPNSSRWWPFSELSPWTTFLLLSWPLAVGSAVSLLRSLRKRRASRI